MSMSIRSPGVRPGMPHIHSTPRSARSVRGLTPKAAATSATGGAVVLAEVRHEAQQPTYLRLARHRAAPAVAVEVEVDPLVAATARSRSTTASRRSTGSTTSTSAPWPATSSAMPGRLP